MNKTGPWVLVLATMLSSFGIGWFAGVSGSTRLNTQAATIYMQGLDLVNRHEYDKRLAAQRIVDGAEHVQCVTDLLDAQVTIRKVREMYAERVAGLESLKK